MNDFNKSAASAERRLTWSAIKRSDLSNNEKSALRYLVNLWFHHRGQSGEIHPGIEKVAKKSGFSISTGERCLRKFRSLGFLTPIRYAKGGTGCATQYTVSISAIWAAYLPPAPVLIDGELIEFHLTATPSKPRQNPVTEAANPVNLTDCLKVPTNVAPMASQEPIDLEEMERAVWGYRVETTDDSDPGYGVKSSGGRDA